MSPPETNAISRRSGDKDGSDIAARGVGARWASVVAIRFAGSRPSSKPATTDE
jgi:hypothetical protein